MGPPDPGKVTLKHSASTVDSMDSWTYRMFSFSQLPLGPVATSAGIGLSSFLIARSIVRFISETTAGTSRLFTSPTSETALVQTVAPVARFVIWAEIAIFNLDATLVVDFLELLQSSAKHILVSGRPS